MTFETPAQLRAELEAEREYEKTRYMRYFREALKQAVKERILQKHGASLTAADIQQRLFRILDRNDFRQEIQRASSVASLDKDFDSISEELEQAGWFAEKTLVVNDRREMERRYILREKSA